MTENVVINHDALNSIAHNKDFVVKKEKVKNWIEKMRIP